MSPHYLVKCTNFFIFFIFSCVSSTNPRYGRVAEALRHGPKFSRAWWTMQLINGEKDWNHVSVQKLVTLNIYCNVACLTFHLPHIITGSFQSHIRQPTTGFFSEPPTFGGTSMFGGMQYTFSQMKKLCILQGSVVTYFRCGG